MEYCPHCHGYYDDETQPCCDCGHPISCKHGEPDTGSHINPASESQSGTAGEAAHFDEAANRPSCVLLATDADRARGVDDLVVHPLRRAALCGDWQMDRRRRTNNFFWAPQPWAAGDTAKTAAP